MGLKDAKREKQLQQRAKQVRIEFSNYESAVTLISSVEAWFEHRWGSDGLEPGRLERFDRFPDLDGLTPDFVAYFVTPYVLCGERSKTFRSTDGADDDERQVIAYSHWSPPAPARGGPIGYDVLLLVDTVSDDVAARRMLECASSGDPNRTPRAPIVIIGYYLDRERVRGEWYSLKWRDMPGNHRFSEPNVSHNRSRDLNALLTNVTHCPIPVDRSAVDLTGRNPLINDEPPPIYTLVRVVYPAVNQLLTPEEQDRLRTEGRVEKVVARSDILAAPILKGLCPPERYIQRALDWLVRMRLARKTGEPQSPRYVLVFDLERLKRDLLDILTDKEARDFVSRLRLSRRRGAKKRREPVGQHMLFEMPPGT